MIDSSLNPIRPEVILEEDIGDEDGLVDEEKGHGESEELEEDQVEEAMVATPSRSPYAPTNQEREQHETTHLPYRSWCEVCVAGRRDHPSIGRPQRKTVVSQRSGWTTRSSAEG